MPDPTLNDLDQRLRRVEGDARALRSLLGLLVLAGVALFVTLFVWIQARGRDRARFTTLEAREVLIRGPAGSTPARLGVDSTGNGRLILIGKDGTRRVETAGSR